MTTLLWDVNCLFIKDVRHVFFTDINILIDLAEPDVFATLSVP